MPLDMKELEDYVRKAENKYKENFLLIEKRFAELEKKMEVKPASAAAMPVARKLASPDEEQVIVEGSEIKTMDDVRDRIQELEDLLLLIELENTKLRESVAAGTEITPAVAPDINERLTRLEEQISSAPAARDTSGLEEKIRELEEKLQRLESAPRIVTRAERVTVTKKPMEEEEKSSILEEVEIILGKK